MYLYAIKDKVAEEFGPVFTAKNAQVAARSFITDIVGKFQINLVDFELVELAEYNVETGEIKPRRKPLVVEVNAKIAEAIEEKKDAESIQ